MAVNNRYKQISYGLSQALIGIPSEPLISDRDPQTTDQAPLGTIWVNKETNSYWILTSIVSNIANWEANGGTPGATNFVADVGNAVPAAGTLVVTGYAPLSTMGVGNTLSIMMSNGTDGQLLIGGGAQPTWASITSGDGSITITQGPNSLDIEVTGGTPIDQIDGDTGSATGSTITFDANTNSGKTVTFDATGSDVFLSVTDANNNTAIGVDAGNGLTTGERNTFFGDHAGYLIADGGDNIALGYRAGENIMGADASNILIGNGGQMGDSNIIRIGTEGSGAGQQDTCFIAGIEGVDLNTAEVVTVDLGQLGSSTLTGGSNISVTPGANVITLAVSGTTNHALQLGNAGGSLTSLGVATNGQLPIGSTGADPVLATLTAGTNISITNGAGSISIAASGPAGLTWSVINADQTAVVNTGYICNKAGALVLTLPAASAVGDVIEVTGINTALGWKIAQGAGQTIYFGTSTTTTGAGGYLQSSAIRDSIKIVCVVANLDWNVVAAQGNITVV